MWRSARGKVRGGSVCEEGDVWALVGREMEKGGAISDRF